MNNDKQLHRIHSLWQLFHAKHPMLFYISNTLSGVPCNISKWQTNKKPQENRSVTKQFAEMNGEADWLGDAWSCDQWHIPWFPGVLGNEGKCWCRQLIMSALSIRWPEWHVLMANRNESVRNRKDIPLKSAVFNALLGVRHSWREEFFSARLFGCFILRPSNIRSHIRMGIE